MSHRKLPEPNPRDRHGATPATRGRGLLTWVGPAPDSEQMRCIGAAQLQLQCAPDRRSALLSALPWVAVVHAELPDGNGVDLVQELQRRQPNLRSFVVATQTSFELCRRAFRAGATDVWPAPVHTDVLTEALAATANPGSATGHSLESTDRLRALAVRLLADGIGPWDRARIVSAVAQATQDLEAAGAAASIELSQQDQRLRIELSAPGGPEELEVLRDALLGDPRSHGLARAQLLSDELRLEQTAGGLRIDLVFARADTEAFEPEWLDRSAADAALESVHRGCVPFSAESPLAPVLGAWLGPRAAREAERRAQRSLWS